MGQSTLTKNKPGEKKKKTRRIMDDLCLEIGFRGKS